MPRSAKPALGDAGILAAGGPQIQARLGMIDGEARVLDGRLWDAAAGPVAPAPGNIR